MLKRFMVGFVVGIGAMYWYLHYYDAAFTGANSWVERSASHYRGDHHHEIADHTSAR
jgi:hypothetical protein